MNHTVNIVEGDITAGEVFSLSKCPLGLAMKRAFRGKRIRVGYKFVSVEDVGQYDLYQLPKECTSWLHLYETGHGMEPLEVKLTAVERNHRRSAA